jgi:phosphate transport system substrate-binding protein
VVGVAVVALTVLWVALLAGCPKPQSTEAPAVTPSTTPSIPSGGQLTGQVQIDGSSTVYPIQEAIAEEFAEVQPDVKVTVGVSGTGGGFKRFCVGETDISNASRAIKDEEIKKCAENTVEYIELPIAFDGISIVVNPKNTWCESLTVAELKKIWEPQSKVKSWKDVRPSFPDKPITLYGPGTDSGTFEYFTEEIVGKKKESRSDYTASEDDNMLVQGIAGDGGALGYFGFSYWEENQDKLKLIPVDAGGGAVAPSAETIRDGSYKPLSRPLFVYVAKASTDRPEVDAYVKFMLDNAGKLSAEVGAVALPDAVYAAARQRYEQKTTGSAITGQDVKGKTLEQIYGAQ